MKKRKFSNKQRQKFKENKAAGWAFKPQPKSRPVAPVKAFDGEDFYKSREWREIRVKVLERYKCSCMMCGRSPQAHGIVIHVDHIKPISRNPSLALNIENLQILCEDCNLGKGNRYQTDYRPC